MAKCGKFLIFLLICNLFLSCNGRITKNDIQIPKIETQKLYEKSPQISQEKQEFRIENSPINPLELRRISINVRATPLKDVLYVISKDAGLNLILDKKVDPDIPITLILSNVTLQDALDSVIGSTDYFYKIERNMLKVSATDMRIFHLNILSVHQTYSTEIGGDILGGVTGQLAGGGGGGGSGSSSADLKGNVFKREKSDDSTYKFWENIESALTSILGSTIQTTTRTQQTAVQPQTGQTQTGQPQTGQTQTPTQQVRNIPNQPANEYFVINRLTGTIMVVATKRNMQKIEKYLENIKFVMNRQVLIEAKVIEVSLFESLRYGIDWRVISERVTKTIPWYVTGGTHDFIRAIPNNYPFSDINLTITTGSIRDLSIIIQALSEFGEVRTLSNPRVNIMNGQTSILTIGRNFSFISKAQSNVTTSGTNTPIITYTVETSNLLSGLMIGIVPYIDENGEISMTITPVISNLININERTYGSAGAQTLIQLPIVDLRELSTSVKVKDGEIIIIGGLIKKEENLSENKTPVFGDIPILGSLFKGQDKVNRNTELVILLQPRIISR